MTTAEGGSLSSRQKDSVVAHYEAQLARHGPTARGMDWKDEASQRLRFEVLCDVASIEGASLLEVGSGAGHLRDFLTERGMDVRYSGVDLSAAMVEAARRRHPDVVFEQRDILADPPSARYDLVVCSGLFHVRSEIPEEAWWGFVQEIVRRMFELCRVGIAFNAMTDQVDFRSPSLYYADPSRVFEFCRRELSRFTSLRHDYPLHEFTVHVRRETRGG